jgi:hypothetical protein
MKLLAKRSADAEADDLKALEAAVVKAKAIAHEQYPAFREAVVLQESIESHLASCLERRAELTRGSSMVGAEARHLALVQELLGVGNAGEPEPLRAKTLEEIDAKVRAAREALVRQRSVVSTELMRWVRLVDAQLQDVYDGQVAEIAGALAALAHAQARHLALFHALSDHDVPSQLRHMAVAPLGDPADPSSTFGLWRREAKEHRIRAALAPYEAA